MRPLEKLLKRFLDLQSGKWHLVYRVYHKKTGLISFYNSMRKLRRIVLLEIMLCRKIERSGLRMVERVNKKKLKALLRSLVMLCEPLISVLQQEYKLLTETRLPKLRKNNVLLERQAHKFHDMFNKEMRLSRKFDGIVLRHGSTLGIVKGYSAKRKEFERTKRLLQLSREAFRQLLRAEDVKEAARANRELTQLLNMLQRTEMYDYIKNDVEFVRRKAKYIIQHPKEHKLIYFLTGIYLVSPFTFEATGALLTLKYATKYAVSKSRKVGSRLRRKRQLKVME